jgi:hypothetical protein
MCPIQEPRLRLIAGQPVWFGRTDPAAERTIPVEWIEEAVRKNARVNVANAIIRRPLQLRYMRFTEEFSLLRFNQGNDGKD